VLKIAGLPEPSKHKPNDTMPFLFSKKYGIRTVFRIRPLLADCLWQKGAKMGEKIYKAVVVFFVVMCFCLVGCASHAVHQCMERHPWCRWNCELQYGVQVPGSRSSEMVQRNAATERCSW
jgi:hypothetical protein